MAIISNSGMRSCWVGESFSPTPGLRMGATPQTGLRSCQNICASSSQSSQAEPSHCWEGEECKDGHKSHGAQSNTHHLLRCERWVYFLHTLVFDEWKCWTEGPWTGVHAVWAVDLLIRSYSLASWCRFCIVLQPIPRPIYRPHIAHSVHSGTVNC